MARVTVEDCVQQIPNRFELVLIAAKRARRLSTGAAQSVLDWENDKATVLALREIAAGYQFGEEEEAAQTQESRLAGAVAEFQQRNILGSDTEQ